MRIFRAVLLLCVVIVAAGCAHPVIISPDMAAIAPDAAGKKIPKNVGYYLPSNLRNAEVTTPSGGGDKVIYKPYADMETAYYKMLSNVFQSVTVIDSPDDVAKLNQRDISYVVSPEISTDSSSNSVITWMATDFTVNLKSKVSDTSGKPVTGINVTGKGHADFDEFKSRPSLSGQRAALDALMKTQTELLNSTELRK